MGNTTPVHSKNLLDLKIIDEIILEPIGGAHRDKDLILENVRRSVEANLNEFFNSKSNRKSGLNGSNKVRFENKVAGIKFPPSSNWFGIAGSKSKLDWKLLMV